MSWPDPLPTFSPLDTVANLHTKLNLFRDAQNFLKRPPACRARRTATQSIPNGTETAVAFTAADDFDTDNMHNPSSQSSRMTINTAGLYLFVANIRFTAAAGGGRMIILRFNGVFSFHREVRQGDIRGVGDNPCRIPIATIQWMGAGNFCEVFAYQSSGGSANIESDGRACNSFAALWLCSG